MKILYTNYYIFIYQFFMICPKGKSINSISILSNNKLSNVLKILVETKLIDHEKFDSFPNVILNRH